VFVRSEQEFIFPVFFAPAALLDVTIFTDTIIAPYSFAYIAFVKTAAFIAIHCIASFFGIVAGALKHCLAVIAISCPAILAKTDMLGHKVVTRAVA
jgi:hypothetical protein